MQRIFITDVAPRDGLQNQPVGVSTASKLRLIELLAKAGVASIEATSFVSPKAVPQMADATELVTALAGRDDIRVSVLAPNLRGLQRAISAGAREVAIVLAATETMNRKNINLSLKEAVSVSSNTIHAAKAAGLRTRAYVAVAFECPFEGLVPVARLTQLAGRMHDEGADEVVIADTIGAASPTQVRNGLAALRDVIPVGQLGVHFHNTRGMGVANAWVALESGVRRFDSSAGGIGGCPFAPGASGNLATEDLVLMAEQCGFDTGISLDGLVEAIAFAEKVLGRSAGGEALSWYRSRMSARARSDSPA